MFVNPRRRRKGGKKGRKASRARRKKSYRRVKGPVYRRNSGITPFVSNPLIMSPNPRRRRRRNVGMVRNPLNGLNLKSVVQRGITFGGGAAIAVGANALFLNSLENFWVRNGIRFGGAILSAGFLKGDLGAATSGAMLYPMMQELMAKFFAPARTATEADLEGLAADLEDVMEDLDESDLSDDDEMYLSDDDDVLS